MSIDRIALIVVCAAAIGFGLVETSKSQSAAAGDVLLVVPGGALQNNFVSVWILEPSTKELTACQYQGGGPITCAAKQKILQ
jgi:hypothetical protein